MTELPLRIMFDQRDGFDPVADLAKLRVEEPVRKVKIGAAEADRSIWLATGYREVREILADSRTFSTRRRFSDREPSAGGPAPRPAPMVGNLMDYDPPEHTRLRRLLTREFTAHRIRRLEPRVQAVADELLDTMEDAGAPADLVRHFARPISSAVLCELLGVPRDDRAEFERRAHQHIDPGRSRQQRAAAGAVLEQRLAGLVARARKDPGDDMIGMLLREHGPDITDQELTGIGILMLLAGLDNVSGMLGLGVLLLLQHPDQLAMLRRDPALADRAVEELLRYLSVVHAPTPRVAVEDALVSGQLIKAGERVACSIPSANRDVAVAAQPDRFDVTREPAPHVAFGHGIHHCLGASLARMELRIGYLAVLRRFPGLRLSIPFEAVRFRLHTPAYGVESLPVQW